MAEVVGLPLQLLRVLTAVLVLAVLPQLRDKTCNDPESEPYLLSVS